MHDVTTLNAQDLKGLSKSAVTELATALLAQLAAKDEDIARRDREIKFKDVKIEETRGSAPDRSVVNVTVPAVVFTSTASPELRLRASAPATVQPCGTVTVTVVGISSRSACLTSSKR